MSSIMVSCPITASAIYMGIEMDEESFVNLPADVVSQMFCSACGGAAPNDSRTIRQLGQ
jgi:hypothetical protein